MPGGDGSDVLMLAITTDANGPAGSHCVRHAVMARIVLKAALRGSAGIGAAAAGGHPQAGLPR